MTEKPQRKKHINRLKTMYALRNLVNEAYMKTLQAGNDGKPTAWSMVNFFEGDVIMKAMDIEVVYPENYATIAASMGAAEQFLGVADAEGFPSQMCGYARTTLGYTARMMKECGGQVPPEAPIGGMAKPGLLVSSGAACDARYKWFQALGRYLDAPQWVLELPHIGVEELREEEVRVQAIEFMVKELRLFVEFLERFTKRKMDYDRLDRMVDTMLEIHRVFHEINELRRARPSPMHSCDFWSSMPACLFLAGDPEVSLDLYRKMLLEVKERVEKGVAGINGEEKFRLVFAELPPWHSLHFFEDLAERGWNFVMESFSYHPVPPFDLDGVKDPLERIARISFQVIHGLHARAMKDGISFFLVQPYLEYASRFRCDGAFLHPLLSCRMASSHLKAVQDSFMKRMMIPSLYVEGDIIDIRLFNPARTLTNAEAFEESMLYYRDERKKSGLEW